MTQREKVIKLMKASGSITSMEAFAHLRITRLSAVIYDIEHKDGIQVYRKNEKSNGSTFTRYSLEEFSND